MGQGKVAVWAVYLADYQYSPDFGGIEVTAAVNELLIPLILSLTAAGTTVAATWKILASVIGNLTKKLDEAIEQRNAADIGRIKGLEDQALLKNDMADLARQMQGQQSEISKLKTKVIELQGESDARLITIQNLQEKIESDDKNRAALEKQVKELTATVHDQNESIETLNESIKTLTKERDDLRIRAERAEKAEAELTKRVTALEKASEPKPENVNPTMVLTAPPEAIREGKEIKPEGSSPL